MHEEEAAEDDFCEEIQEEDDDSQGEEDLPPPTRNVLLKARPPVFAAFEVMTLIGVAAYAYWNPRPLSEPLRLSCSSLDCYNLQAELHQSMDLGAEPCDDFYQYVCGHWPEGHSRFEDQFRYIEARVYWAANDLLRERQSMYLDPSRELTAFDKAALSYVACAEVIYRGIDVPWLIDSALFIGKEKPEHFLAPSGSDNASSEVLATLISLAMDYDLDVLFEIVLAPEARSDNRSVLNVGHSLSLMRWKRHRERYLTPESMARCMRSFISAMSCDCALDPGLTAQLVAIDVQKEPKPTEAGATGLDSISGPTLVWNVTEDSELYATDPKIFGIVDETLAMHPESHLRYYVAFQVVRALAPFTSHRLTELLFSDDNATAVYLYAADACAAAAGKITSFALASFIFQDVLMARRVQVAHDQVDSVRNETMAALSWLKEGAQESARQRLATLRSLVAWPQRLNGSDSTGAYFLGLPDFRGYYVEIYLDSVAALRKRDKARLLLANATADNSTALTEEGVPFEGFRHDCLTNVYKAAASVGAEKDADSQMLAKAASENLADVAGLQVAYAAYRAAVSAEGSSARNESAANATDSSDSWISRVTGFQERDLFFIASCFKWCASVADQVVRSSVGFTPARLRCNVPVALTSGFADTFGCKKEHRMSQIAANYSCESPGEPIVPPASTVDSGSDGTDEATELTPGSFN
ncbi:hypothetical protein V5799_005582 [Amblyomma americanum]|uniref:M13 family peptidase n=1 Tax=Amblyomma americanum TaxID=6943 RepID=A0AAQ4DYU6_AMBAM